MSALPSLARERFHVDDGVVVYDGHERPTADIVEAFYTKLGRLESSLRAAGQLPPFPLLVDLRRLAHLDAAGRRVIYRRANEANNWRVAVLGATILQRMIVEFLRLATGFRRMHYFTEIETAVAWLRGAEPRTTSDD